MTSVLSKNIIPATVLGTALGCYVLSSLYKTFFWKDFGTLKDSQIKIHKKDFKKDVVYVYGFSKIKGVMCSPFVHKLLAYLQLTGIPHEVVKGDHMGKNPRSKLPFVELNGQVITDSAIIISVLSGYFDKNIDADLTKEEAATSLAIIRLLEDHYYFGMVYYRWKYASGFKQFLGQIPVPGFIRPSLQAKVVQQLTSQGMGRYNDETVIEVSRDDLTSVSTLLSSHEFFFGKSTPHLVDLVLYAALACQDNAVPTPFYSLLSEFPSLLSHKKRMEALIPINNKSA